MKILSKMSLSILLLIFSQSVLADTPSWMDKFCTRDHDETLFTVSENNPNIVKERMELQKQLAGKIMKFEIDGNLETFCKYSDGAVIHVDAVRTFIMMLETPKSNSIAPKSAALVFLAQNHPYKVSKKGKELCKAFRGEVKKIKNLDICIFEDNSMIDINAMIGGPSAYPKLYNALINVLYYHSYLPTEDDVMSKR